MKIQSVLLLAIFTLAICPAHAQTKLINLGGGFGFDTKIQQPFNYKSLDKLFPIKYTPVTQQSFGRPTIISTHAEEQKAEIKNPVRTICGETVEKESSVKLIEARDWYVQKGSECAERYLQQWQSQQDTSFVAENEKRTTCESSMPTNNLAKRTCPFCKKAIDVRCGSVNTWTKDSKKNYAHSDCFAKHKHTSLENALRDTLGLSAVESQRFAKQKADRLAAQHRMIEELKSLPVAPVASAAQQIAPAMGASVPAMESVPSQQATLQASALPQDARIKQSGKKRKAMASPTKLTRESKKQLSKEESAKKSPAAANTTQPETKNFPSKWTTESDLKKFAKQHEEDMPLILAVIASNASTGERTQKLVNEYVQINTQYQKTKKLQEQGLSKKQFKKLSRNK